MVVRQTCAAAQATGAHDGSVARWRSLEAPWSFTGGTIKRVAVDVSGDPYVDLEREAVAMMSRE